MSPLPHDAASAGAGDPFAASAPFYDLDLLGYDEDVDLYRMLAEQAEGPVLELGCGTGRVAASLAEAGFEVVGVDVSPAMLEVARERAEHVPPGRLALVEDDVRTLDLGRRFPLVLAPLGSMQHMERDEDVLAAFEAVALHLEPDGLAVIDVEAPHPDDFSSGTRPLIEHWTRDTAGGGQVTKLVAAEADPAAGLRHITFHYDAQEPDGALRRTTHRFALRVFTPGELAFAARAAGLRLVGLDGDYAGTPYGDGAERMVAFLQHLDAGTEENEE